MNTELVKIIVTVVGAALSSYLAIRVDLTEMKTAASYNQLRIERLEHKLDK